MRVFIIGPGGVGKSTAGAVLARKIGHDFIDLDQEFCDRIENIRLFIKDRGYRRYCFRNSELFYSILDTAPENFVLALSSGFLAHEGLDDLTERHRKTLVDSGVSVLLLPSDSLEEGRKTVVDRQLRRGFGLNGESEAEKYAARFRVYRNLGDIRVFSRQDPERIAEEMERKLSVFRPVGGKAR